MKKTFYDNFLPTKAEEEVALSRNIPHQMTRTLVAVTDVYPQRRIMDLENPWQMRKYLTKSDILTGKLILSHEDTFEHVFRYWSLETANHVLVGCKYFVALIDYTIEENPKRFQGENIYLERGPEETYILGWLDLALNRGLSVGDEIGLSWDCMSVAFHFKLLRRVWVSDGT